MLVQLEVNLQITGVTFDHSNIPDIQLPSKDKQRPTTFPRLPLYLMAVFWLTVYLLHV